ncbi:MAG TPA: ligand-binding protein SH3 [Candidatus Pacebacteria bacterium]|nr:ligand-binding protein SH3 [Candidatus Paceibacterota bacterium]
MKEKVIEVFSVFSDSVATVLIAMIPITELRASIPIAITQFGMSPIVAMGYSILGNVIAGALVLFFVEHILHLFLVQSKVLESLWQKYINRIHKNNKEKFEKWGSVMLVAFVAIPLPMTGIFTGAVAASIFQIPFRQAFPLLSIGSVISGIIVTLITIGTTNII